MALTNHLTNNKIGTKSHLPTPINALNKRVSNIRKDFAFDRDWGNGNSWKDLGKF